MSDHTPDFAVKLLCQAQGGYFTVAQADERGMSPHAIRRRTDRGLFEHAGYGLYRDIAVPDSDRSRRFAALLAVGRGAVLARETAAEVHELGSAPDCEEVHVVLSCTCPHDRPGVVVHRSLTLLDRHVTEIASQPVTTVARTICDLAAMAGPVRLRRLVAEAVRKDLTTAGQLRSVMADMGRFRGKALLHEIVDELSPLHEVTRSTLESEFVMLTTDAEIPPTAMNHPVTDVNGRRRYIDAVYLPPGLPIELDSRLAHGSLLDWHDDMRRENHVILGGNWLPFLRYNWYDVTNRGHLVVSEIKDVLARSS